MTFPVFVKKLNRVIAIICGCMVVIISILTVFEAVARAVFNSPTSWSLNFCTWLLIWFAFLGSAYSFQEHGHVGVDMFKDFLDKHTKTRLPRRIMAVSGYCVSIVFIGVLLYGGIQLSRRAVSLHQMTATVTPIPMVVLTSAMVAGCLLMILTLVCIILDLLGKGTDYL